MNIIQRVHASFRSDREKLKNMSWKQKLQFCFAYYRGLAVVFLILCLGLFYLGDVVIQSRTELVLQGFFANDEKNLFPAKEIMKDYAATLALPRSERISFDDSLYVDLTSSADYAASSQGKIVAYIAAKELDFLVVPEPLLSFYTDSLPCYALEPLLPADLSEALSRNLYFVEDGNKEYKACALSMSGSRYMEAAPDYSGPDYYMIVPSNTTHADAVAQFIRYSFSSSPISPKD